MAKYKLVVCDVDGTLIPPAAHPASGVSPAIIEAVAQTQEKGILVSMATARSLDWVLDLIKKLNIKAPIILDNGARIYHCGEKRYLKELFLPVHTAKNIADRLSAIHGKVVFVDHKGRHEYNPYVHTALNKVVKMMVLHIPPERAEAIYQQIKNTPDTLITKSISGHNPTVESIHVTNGASGKDVALLEIAKYLHLNTEEIIGIGDSYNDLDFLKICGLKVAMSNSVAEVKKMADYIAPSYEEDGVADVLQKFVLGEQKDQMLVVVDKNGVPQGTAKREDCHRGMGKTHLAFMAFVIDGDGRLILTKRSRNKSLWPGFWDASVVSHVLPGETVEKAANRRGKEELGVDAPFRNIGAFYYFVKQNDLAENEYCHVLIGKTDKTVNPNPVEIEGLRLTGISELKREIETHPGAFTPWLKIAVEKYHNVLN